MFEIFNPIPRRNMARVNMFNRRGGRNVTTWQSDARLVLDWKSGNGYAGRDRTQHLRCGRSPSDTVGDYIMPAQMNGGRARRYA